MPVIPKLIVINGLENYDELTKAQEAQQRFLNEGRFYAFDLKVNQDKEQFAQHVGQILAHFKRPELQEAANKGLLIYVQNAESEPSQLIGTSAKELEDFVNSQA